MPLLSYCTPFLLPSQIETSTSSGSATLTLTPTPHPHSHQELFRYLSETRPYETYVVTLPDGVA